MYFNHSLLWFLKVLVYSKDKFKFFDQSDEETIIYFSFSSISKNCWNCKQVTCSQDELEINESDLSQLHFFKYYLNIFFREQLWPTRPTIGQEVGSVVRSLGEVFGRQRSYTGKVSFYVAFQHENWLSRSMHQYGSPMSGILTTGVINFDVVWISIKICTNGKYFLKVF